MAFPHGVRAGRAPFYSRGRSHAGGKLPEPDLVTYFEALLRLADYIAQAPERRPLVEAALDAALNPLALDRGGLYLVQESGGDLVLEAARGMPPPVTKRRGRQTIAEAGTGLAGASAHTQRPFAVENLQREPTAKELVAGFREAGVEAQSAAA